MDTGHWVKNGNDKVDKSCIKNCEALRANEDELKLCQERYYNKSYSRQLM